MTADQISTGAGQGADAATAATEPVRRPGSLPSNPMCIHGKAVYERCLPCEEGLKRGEHGGFVRAEHSSSNQKAAGMGWLGAVAKYGGRKSDQAGATEVLAEIERLTAALATANANHERFEREWYLRGDQIERLQRRVAELEPYQARSERLCNLIMGLNHNEGLSPGALSGLQRMAEAAKRASTPPSESLDAKVGAVLIGRGFLDRMKDLTCDDTTARIVSEFLRAVRPVITEHRGQLTKSGSDL